MSGPIRIPLSEPNRERLLALHQQKAQVERDTKLIVDTILGTLWASGDPLWGASIELAANEIVVTPKDDG